MSAQFIFTMHKVSRFYPPDRKVLTDITLAFFPGAKIGVIGANGSGKSSLLRIMAGVDSDFQGEARPADGIRIGFLPQEPTLDPSRNVRENVELAVAPIRELLTQFERLSERFSEP